ncbi:hypothetical protein DFH29DRAFT_1056258 [Suillus ampliporus]|nr:hypothetical protein DFH29DRAFT_1056258 [Suillus ampliporus]
MPGARGAPRKGKSAIPKPARGSGLPIADQLHLEAEQPWMPEFDFNPHGGSGSVGWQAEGLGSSSNDYPSAQAGPSAKYLHQRSYTGPARTTTTRAVRQTVLPTTPYSTLRTPAVPTAGQALGVVAAGHEMLSNTEASPPPIHNTVSLTKETVVEMVQVAKVKVAQIIFTKYAMAYSKRQRKQLIDKVIEDSVLNQFGPNVKFQTFITNIHHEQVQNALSAKRGKIIEFAQEGVCNVFQLFPPQGHPTPPEPYRTARINHFTLGMDPLLFMHDVYFDENNNIIIRTKFQNRFIMANIIRFIWYWGHESNLGPSPLTTIKYVLAVAGAATSCALCKQGKGVLELDPFGGQIHYEKFKQITSAFHNLTPAEKVDFERYLQYMLDIGPSQKRSDRASMSSTSDSE